MNPYTGRPMEEVPASQPSPGDYSQLTVPEGWLLLLHYRNSQGAMASVSLGLIPNRAHEDQASHFFEFAIEDYIAQGGS